MAYSTAAPQAHNIAQQVDMEILNEILALKKRQRELANYYSATMAQLDYKIEQISARSRSQVVCLVGNHETSNSISIKIHGTAHDVNALVNDRTRHCPKGAKVIALMPCPNFGEVKVLFARAMAEKNVKCQRGWYTISKEMLREYLATKLKVRNMTAELSWILEYAKDEDVKVEDTREGIKVEDNGSPHSDNISSEPEDNEVRHGDTYAFGAPANPGLLF
jgi:hypothetical protein